MLLLVFRKKLSEKGNDEKRKKSVSAWRKRKENEKEKQKRKSDECKSYLRPTKILVRNRINSFIILAVLRRSV